MPGQSPPPAPTSVTPAATQGDYAAEPETGSASLTLHVYAAHVQIPALVLTRSLQPVSSINAEQFRIRLDSGRPFPPSSVHLEGEDPINMAVLFDAAGSEDELLTQLTPALVQLRNEALHTQDSVHLFAVDCSTVRFIQPLPREVEGIAHAASAVLDGAALHGGKAHGTCEGSLHLWDAMAHAVKALAPMQGRKVILALTAGRDRGSQNTWTGLGSFASAHSVAIFASTGQKSPYGSFGTEASLWNLCGLTGGVAFPAINAKELAKQMTLFVGMLRHRYILEFARSNKLTAGGHTVDVEVPHTQAFVRVTGVSVPMLDKKLREDPATVPYLEADGPEVGTRRPPNPGLPKQW